MSFEISSLASRTHHIGPSLRNRVPIHLKLRSFFDEHNPTPQGFGLDLSAGSGAHFELLAPAFPSLQWTATEYLDPAQPQSPTALAIIDAHTLGIHANVSPAVALDMRQPFEQWPASLQAMTKRVQLVHCCNVIHITPWTVCEGLFHGVGKLLNKNGVFSLYGPFAEAGKFSSQGNIRFDAMLRNTDPTWGIRDLDEVEPLANRAGLQLVKRFEMPANNLLLFFRSSSH